MKALVEGGHGRVTFPALDDDPLWKAMHDPQSDWFIGTLPNRFRASVHDPDVFRPEGDDPCSRAVQENWKKLTDAVWDEFVKPVAASGKETREIWDRQTGSFWETSWVLGEEPGDGSDGAWLDRRKNWRTHVAMREEPGDHCRIFGDLQELSGWVRARGGGERQRAFWEELRTRVRERITPSAGDTLELGPTERLSAPALIKRLFPCLPAGKLEEVFGWIPQGLQKGAGRGRPGSIRFWPSTARVAALPWMISAAAEVPDACRSFAATVRECSPVEAVAERGARLAAAAKAGSLGHIDGTLFFEDAVETDIRNVEQELERAKEQRNPQLEARLGDLKEIAKSLRVLLVQYRERVAPARTGRQVKAFTPSPFYALLVMDGDSIGKAINRHGSELSQALATFGRKVPGIVRAHDGTPIYAGGDDVQAFLPLTEAIPCAVALHRAYLGAVGPLGDDGLTISAGLAFAHFHVPLASVIREAHRLLEEEAKDGNGRDSIAIAVHKPSGIAAKFVTRFGERVTKIQDLARAYAVDPERSTSFLYNLKDRYRHVLDMFADRDEDLKRLLLAEWLLGSGKWTPAEDRRVEDLMEVCRSRPGPQKEREARPRFDISAGLIARFLADAGVGTLEVGATAGAEA